MKVLYFLPIAVQCYSEIYFKSDYENVIEYPLYPGTVYVKYDLDRAKCPHSVVNGQDDWTVSLCYSINDQVFPEIAFAGSQDAPLGRVAIQNVPKGDLSMWFRCSSNTTTYDSNMGKNYNFKVKEMPVIRFKADYTHELINGPLVTGGSVSIEYDQDRATCASARLAYGPETKHSIMYYSANGHHARDTPILENNLLLHPTIEFLEKGDLAIWFRCVSMGDSTFDSNYSKNFHFVVE